MSPRSQKWLIATLVVFGIVAVSIIGGGAWLARSLPQVMADRTGRRIEVRGPLHVNLGSLRPAVVAHDVTIGNPPWMPKGVFAEVSTLKVVVDMPLPLRATTIRHLELSGARIHLVRDSAGRANWQWRDPRTGRRSGGLMIHGLQATRAQVVLDDARRHLQFAGTVSAGEVARTSGVPALKIRGEGMLNGRSATFEILGDSLATAERDKPYPFTLDERSDGARLAVKGVLPKPFDIGLMDATFTASGKTLRDLSRMTGFAMPESRAFSLAGKLERRHERANFTHLQARVGESDIDGSLVLATEQGARRFETELHSGVLRLDDFGRHEAQDSSGTPGRKKPLFSDAPIPLGIVKNREGIARYRADRVVAGPLRLSQFDARATIRDGTLEVPSMEWQLDDARFTGTVKLDATPAIPTASVDLGIVGLQMKYLSRKRWKQPPFEGRLHARLRLDGEGKSLRQLASTVDGTLTAVIPKGAMRASLAELTGVNLRGLGLALQGGSSETPLRCAVASFEARDGVFESRQFLIDTDAVLIEGDGAIDLTAESLDLKFRGQPKKLRLGRVQSPLHVRGALRSPSFSLDEGRVLAQAGKAALLGVAIAPIAAVLALVDPGLAHDANCAELVGPKSR